MTQQTNFSSRDLFRNELKIALRFLYSTEMFTRRERPNGLSNFFLLDMPVLRKCNAAQLDYYCTVAIYLFLATVDE